jgi:hypothetical protein
MDPSPVLLNGNRVTQVVVQSPAVDEVARADRSHRNLDSLAQPIDAESYSMARWLLEKPEEEYWHNMRLGGN